MNAIGVISAVIIFLKVVYDNFGGAILQCMVPVFLSASEFFRGLANSYAGETAQTVPTGSPIATPTGSEGPLILTVRTVDIRTM